MHTNSEMVVYNKIVKFTPSDDPEKIFEVPIEIARMSGTIRALIDDLCDIDTPVPDIAIPISNVRSFILEKVIEFCKYRFENPDANEIENANENGTEVPMLIDSNAKNDESSKALEVKKEDTLNDTSIENEKKIELSEWDQNFVNVDQQTLFEMILAANYLDVKSMLDITCKAVANMIIGKTPEEIRKTFNIKNDFTPEEEEKILKETQWCDDDEEEAQ